ncbi:MAG: histidine phosphatase family protein [Acidobacteriota bacterium]
MRLWILRHGVAEPLLPDNLDFERTLTLAGKQELALVLKAAKRLGIDPNVLLTSPLRRAKETAEIALGVLPCPAAVETPTLIPNAAPERAWAEIAKYGVEARVLVVGHQPNLGKLIAYVLGCDLSLDLKKAGLVCLEATQPSGKSGPPKNGVLRWALTPKVIANLRK